MQVINVTGATGTGPYNVYLCDVTLTTCILISGATFIPPTISIVLPPLFAGNVQVAVKLEDTSTGCIDFQLFSCLTPTPTPTLTPTMTPTSTPSVCRCIQFVNNTSNNLPFGYTQCDGTPFVGIVQSATTLYVCGSSPFGDPSVAIGVAAPCVFNTCPTPPPPAPSQSPTPTIIIPKS